MDILSNIQDVIANPSQPITQEWLDEVQQQYPYFNLPALLYLKQHGIEGNEELLGKLAISCADRKVLSTTWAMVPTCSATSIRRKRRNPPLPPPMPSTCS